MDPGHFLRRRFGLCTAIFIVAVTWPQLGRSQPTGMQPEAEKLLRRMGDYLAKSAEVFGQHGKHHRGGADFRSKAAVR